MTRRNESEQLHAYIGELEALRDRLQHNADALQEAERTGDTKRCEELEEQAAALAREFGEIIQRQVGSSKVLQRFVASLIGIRGTRSKRRRGDE